MLRTRRILHRESKVIAVGCQRENYSKPGGAPRRRQANLYGKFTRDDVDLEVYRLRKMPDEELIREGKAGRYLCSPMANFGKPPRKVFVVQLEEVKTEWRRRHPKSDNDGSATPK